MVGQLTRRHFLLTSTAASGGAAIRAGGGPGKHRAEGSDGFEGFEGYLPSKTQIALTELESGNLLARVGAASGSISTDAGKSWSEPFPFLQQGRPFPDQPLQLVHLCDNRLGLLYTRKDGPADRSQHQRWHFCWSSDQGKNWTPGVEMGMPPHSVQHGVFLQVPYGEIGQLSTGRLVMPLYWQFNGLHEETRDGRSYGWLEGHRIGIEGHANRSEMGGCYARYSDNSGQTWKRSLGSIMVWPLPNEGRLGGFAATHEPVSIELKDSRVLMLMRTRVGRLFQSFSNDGGEHWSLATPTQLSSGDSPCDIGRLPSTGDLLIFWNQCSRKEMRGGYYRSRLSVAISRDEAKSWQHFKTVECSAGMDSTIGYLPPSPIEHIRTETDVGNLPKGFSIYQYPRLAFVKGQVVMTYQADTELVGDPPELKWRGRVKVKVAPEEWFYG